MTEPAGRDRPGLYLHVPFCSAICPYCDFAVQKGRPDQARLFLDALLVEIRGLVSGELRPEATDLAEAISRLVREPFDTVYLGGGTPTYVKPDQLERLFETLHGSFLGLADARWFLEANPEDVTVESAASWRDLGTSTLSLGIQSLDDDELRFLGRRHTAAEARAAVEIAKNAGFETVSVDLIYGLPSQTPRSWTRGLHRALELDVDHLSLYELEIHPRTSFGKRRERGEQIELPEDAQAELFLRTHDILKAAGWDIYEVSNFARTPEHRSRHNQKYWCHTPYLGLGPSAHSFVDGWRFWNEPSEIKRRKLLDSGVGPTIGWERLTPKALALEHLMLGLRTRQGVDLERLRRLLGADPVETNRHRLENWIERGFIVHRDDRLLPTPEGMSVADRLASELELE